MYIIQELQTTGNHTALVPAVTKANDNEADNAYLTALAAAAISNVPIHAVIMYDEHGNVIKSGFYEHHNE